MAPKDEKRPYKKARLFGSLQEMITLRVGEGEQQMDFTIHEKILCEASPFFKTACKPEWMEPKDRVIELPEDDAEVVKMMIYWIYHNEICVARQIVGHEKHQNIFDKALKTPWGLFAQLYVIGQKYQMPRLPNDSIDAILVCYQAGQFSFGISLGAITWVYKNTIKGDNLRTLFFRITHGDIDRSGLTRFSNHLCPEFLFDVAYALAEDDSGETLAENETLISTLDLDEDFCVELHVKGGCNGECEDIKQFSIILDEE